VSFFRSKEKIIEEALPFQGELVHMLEEPLPKGLRGTIYYCLLIVFVALLVSIVFRVDVVVQGAGKLTYDGPPIVLQPYERAMLRSLKVRAGEVVKKGQELVVLDSTFSQADQGALEERKRTLHSQAQRLESESYARTYVPDAADELAGKLQLEIFQQRATEYRSRTRAYDETIQESQAALKRTQSEMGNLEEQLSISSDIESMQENLFASKTNSKIEYLGAKSTRLRAEREFRDTRDRIVELRHRIETSLAQKDSFVQEWRKSALEELNRVRSELAQVEASLTKSHKINSLVVLNAPEDGIVVDVVNRSVGSIIRDAEPLVVMIPSSAPLTCEMELSSAELGDVTLYDSVLVKVDAYPFQRFGGLWGRIRSISHESHQMGGHLGDPESTARQKSVIQGGAHRVVVELLHTRMEKLPEDRSLFPGMTAVGEVHVGRRRLINYILYPLLRGLRESFREA
jgi:hemolysin D